MAMNCNCAIAIVTNIIRFLQFSISYICETFFSFWFLFLNVKVKKKYFVPHKLPGYQRNKCKFYQKFVAVSPVITFHFPKYLEQDEFQRAEKSGE